MEKNDSEAFYTKLKTQLSETSKWPSDYLYKFIVPSDSDNIAVIHKIFDNTGAVITSKKSKKGKYTSVSVIVNMAHPDAVIDKYKEVGALEGVISL